MKVATLRSRVSRASRPARLTRLSRNGRGTRPVPARATQRRVKVKLARKTRPVSDEHLLDSAALWKRYARQGPGGSVEDLLVNQHLPLVRTVVGRLAMTLPAHVASDDLYSAGLVGLLNAVRRFNPTTGVQFETYARVRIRGAVFDELRRLDWVPRSVHDKARKVEEVMRRLEQRNGAIPTSREMAAELNLTEEAYEELLTQIRPATFVCLDSVRSAEQEGEATQHEAVADAGQPDPGYTTARRELARIVSGRLQKLPEVQRRVLSLYYFEDLRLREIAEVFGVTESRISQIHAAAVLSIRSFLHKHDTCPVHETVARRDPGTGVAARRWLN